MIHPEPESIQNEKTRCRCYWFMMTDIIVGFFKVCWWLQEKHS